MRIGDKTEYNKKIISCSIKADPVSNYTFSSRKPQSNFCLIKITIKTITMGRFTTTSCSYIFQII